MRATNLPKIDDFLILREVDHEQLTEDLTRLEEHSLEDAQEFFDRTYFTGTIRKTFESLVETFGKDSSNGCVLLFNDYWGGGKSHLLTSAYFLTKYFNPLKNSKLFQEDFPEFSSINFPSNVSLVCLTGEEVDKDCYVWDAIARALGKPRFFYENGKPSKTGPNKSLIKKFLRQVSPVIILFDEMVTYLYRQGKELGVDPGKYAEQCSDFLQFLADEIKNTPKSAFLATLLDIKEDLQSPALPDKMLVKTTIQNAVARAGKVLDVGVSQDVAQILKARFFKGLKRDLRESEVSPELLGKLKEFVEYLRVSGMFDKIDYYGLDSRDPASGQKLLNAIYRTYPFWPDIFDFIEERWAGTHGIGFQRARDFIKYFRHMLKFTESESFLRLHHLDFEDRDVSKMYSTFCSARNLKKEYLEAEFRVAKNVDNEEEVRRLSRTHNLKAKDILSIIFFGSGLGERGKNTESSLRLDALSEEEILINLTSKVDDRTISRWATKVLRLFEKELFHLRTKEISGSVRYFIHNKQNLNNRISQYRRRVSEEEVDKFIDKHFFRGSSGWEKIKITDLKNDEIPRDPKLKLVYCSESALKYADAKDLEGFLKKTLETYKYRRNVVLAGFDAKMSAAKRQEFCSLAKELIALKKLQEEVKKELEERDKALLKERIKETTRLFYLSGYAAYRKVCLPALDWPEGTNLPGINSFLEIEVPIHTKDFEPQPYLELLESWLAEKLYSKESLPAKLGRSQFVEWLEDQKDVDQFSYLELEEVFFQTDKDPRPVKYRNSESFFGEVVSQLVDDGVLREDGDQFLVVSRIKEIRPENIIETLKNDQINDIDKIFSKLRDEGYSSPEDEEAVFKDLEERGYRKLPSGKIIEVDKEKEEEFERDAFTSIENKAVVLGDSRDLQQFLRALFSGISQDQAKVSLEVEPSGTGYKAVFSALNISLNTKKTLESF